MYEKFDFLGRWFHAKTAHVSVSLTLKSKKIEPLGFQLLFHKRGKI